MREFTRCPRCNGKCADLWECYRAELNRTKAELAKVAGFVVSAHMRALPPNWAYTDTQTTLDLLVAEISTLRTEKATVTAERDRLREALGLAAKALHLVGHGAPGNSRWRSADFGIRQHCTNAAMAANTALSAPLEPKPEAQKCGMCGGVGKTPKHTQHYWECPKCNGTGRAQ